jgi:hypothetical protein
MTKKYSMFSAMQRIARDQVQLQRQAEAARETYSAIECCAEYHMRTGFLYETRPLDAQKAFDSLSTRAHTLSERNTNQALSNYLLAVQGAHIDWQYFHQSKRSDRDRHEEQLRQP